MTFIIGTPHTHGAGYFKNDDRTSGGKLAEADVQTCAHCQKIIKMQQWDADVGWCRYECKPVCGPCNKRMQTHGCEPFLKQIETHVETLVKLEQHLKIGGFAPTRKEGPQALVLP
jgi:hypothetical protein